MKLCVSAVAAVAAVTASLFVVTAASASVTMDWSTVSNAGNAPDLTIMSDGASFIGTVDYDYRIGTYEVTNSQYAAFLNSVAASDPNDLYSPDMGGDPLGGITRSGTAGSYTYSVRAGMGDRPVNFVSWYDAARMSNWMTNGQGSGGTESGVYTLTGPNSISAITRDLSNPNQVFIPTESEWHKAAYHQPASQGGDADDYWLYPTSSGTINTTQSNYGMVIGNALRPVGWYAANFYGAFDMGGNVIEWNESPIGGDFSRGLRGGAYDSAERALQSSYRGGGDPRVEYPGIGFRLASNVPGPGSVALLVVGAPLLARRRGP